MNLSQIVSMYKKGICYGIDTRQASTACALVWLSPPLFTYHHQFLQNFTLYDKHKKKACCRSRKTAIFLNTNLPLILVIIRWTYETNDNEETPILKKIIFER